MIETTYVMIKPGFAKEERVINEVKARIKKAGLYIEEAALVRYSEELAAKHYAEHIGKQFYPELIEYITSSEAYAMIVSGENAISKIREMAGSTKNPVPGTIRYDIPKMLNWPMRITENVIHSSDSSEAAIREIAIFNSFAEIEVGI